MPTCTEQYLHNYLARFSLEPTQQNLSKTWSESSAPSVRLRESGEDREASPPWKRDDLALPPVNPVDINTNGKTPPKCKTNDDFGEFRLMRNQHPTTYIHIYIELSNKVSRRISILRLLQHVRHTHKTPFKAQTCLLLENTPSLTSPINYSHKRLLARNADAETAHLSADAESI